MMIAKIILAIVVSIFFITNMIIGFNMFFGNEFKVLNIKVWTRNIREALFKAISIVLRVAVMLICLSIIFKSLDFAFEIINKYF